MTTEQILVIVSIGIGVVAIVPYAWDTYHGTTKPNRVSWFLWALIPLVGVAASLDAGGDPWAVARVAMSGITPLLILFLTFFNPQSYWKISSFDVLCGFFAVVALIVWLGIDAPRTAVIFAIIADIFASLPVLIKAYRYPETETGATFVLALIGSLMIVPVIPAFTIENAGFLSYLILVNALLVIFIYRTSVLRWIGRHKKEEVV